MGRFVPINVTTNIAEKQSPSFTGAKTYYDGKQCWQYKVVYDRPGTYTFTVPSNAICARSVLIGGGGKPKCIQVNVDGSGCNSAAGAGGAYSDKCHAVTPGSTTFSIVVGRQEEDSTLSCNGTPVHTAGGASGCIPGTATGGDWNSRGGCVGYTCNNCGGSFSHFCGSCKYICTVACCGYCIVYQYDPSGSGSACCNTLLVGGASAGSPRALCGGCSSNICGYFHSGVAGGGGGIGSTSIINAWHYNCCSCICTAYCSGYAFRSDYPGSAEGGWGSGSRKNPTCRSYTGECAGGVISGGDGGDGGPEGTSTTGFTVEWGYHAICAYPYGSGFTIPEVMVKPPATPPCKVNWWDIDDICGNGSPGVMAELTAECCNFTGTFIDRRPENSGEGAGTGGVMTFSCIPELMGIMIGSRNDQGGPLVNWCRICQLGVCGWQDQAWLPGMQNALFPFFLTCAGTLGGSGGMGWQGYTSKAGKGGGGGQAKCQILCVCYGGAFDCCDQTAGTPLAFAPCLLDQLVSNAGTGMAIIYYREA